MSAFVDRLKLLAVEKSSRLRAATSFVVNAPVGTQSIVIPIKNGRGLNLVPNAEPDLRNVLAKCLAHRSGPVIDVGANVGVFLVALLSIDPSVPYVGFDPDIDCCEYLTSFIQENKLRQHMVFPVALSDRTCTIALKYNHAADVSATIVEGFRPKGMYANTRYVLAVPGDEILRSLFAKTARISVVKIDAEGAERLVLSGLLGTLADHRPKLILEVAPYQHFVDGNLDESYFGRVSPAESNDIVRWRRKAVKDIDEFLDYHRYVCAKVAVDGTLARCVSVDPGTSRNFAEQNYLAVPKEEAKAFFES